jgi:peptidoglycan/LPS O-acetylase OafA/YrhL
MQSCKTAAVATARQLIAVHTGEGVLNVIWHSYAIVEKFTPQLASAMHAARQQKGELSFTAINELHYPLALLAMALLPVIVWLAWRKTIPAALGELAATIALALLGNAFVCGTLSNPHDRYGARMVWLAVFVAIVAALARSPARNVAPACRAERATPN